MKIPASEYDTLVAFVAEPTASLESLARALETDPLPIAPGGWSTARVITLVGEHVGGGRAPDIARLLLALAGVRRQRNETADATVAAIDAALSRQPENVDVEAFRERHAVLSRLISSQSLALMVKVWDLGGDLANAVAEFRVFTDIRPVFDEDGDRPLLGVVTHTLRVQMLDSSSPLGGTVNLTLDGADLVQLSKQVERALRKANAIRSTLGPHLEHGICLLNEMEEDS